MPFSKIKGQERAIAMLREIAASGRIAGAYIFDGSAGVGKRTTGIAFAKRLLCPTGGHSEGCQFCARIEREQSEDIFFWRPMAKKQKFGVSSAAEIEVRDELIRWIQRRTGTDRRKVLFIEDVQKMTAHMANSILKLLEEPVAGSIIILFTTDYSRLLPTIRSRCQRVAFSRLTSETIEAVLTQQQGLAPDAAHRIVILAHGSLGRAIEIAEGNLLELYKEYFSQLGQFLAGKRDVVEATDALLELLPSDSLQQRRELLLDLFDITRLLIRNAYLKECKVDTPSDDIFGDILFDMGDTFDILSVDRFWTVIQRSEELIERNVNIKLLVENLFIELAEIKEQGNKLIS